MSDMQNQGALRAPESQMPHGAKERRDGLAKALVDVTIDGHPLQVSDGTTILEAARQIGIRIPTLCAHQDLCMAGLCRICVVEIEGMRTLQASCAFPINQPMKVFTHTRKVRQARRHIIDLLLVAPLRRVLHLRPQQQLRTAERWPKSTASTFSASVIPRSRSTRSIVRAIPSSAT